MKADVLLASGGLEEDGARWGGWDVLGVYGDADEVEGSEPVKERLEDSLAGVGAGCLGLVVVADASGVEPADVGEGVLAEFGMESAAPVRE